MAGNHVIGEHPRLDHDAAAALLLIDEGLTSRDIAQQLGLTLPRLGRTLAEARRVLSVSSTSEALRAARAAGAIPRRRRPGRSGPAQ